MGVETAALPSADFGGLDTFVDGKKQNAKVATYPIGSKTEIKSQFEVDNPTDEVITFHYVVKRDGVVVATSSNIHLGAWDSSVFFIHYSTLNTQRVDAWSLNIEVVFDDYGNQSWFSGFLPPFPGLPDHI